MQVGFREFLDFERPERDVIDLFAGLPSSNIDDNMNRLYSTSMDLKPANSVEMVGVAFTVKAPAGDNLMFHRALELAKPGDIIVVDGGGCKDRALCGEIMAIYAMHRKLNGFVINGCVRDYEALSKMDFPVYAVGTCSNGPYRNGPGEIGVPVVIGGIVVLPGDILVGDGDGIVVIRPQDALEIAQKAMEQKAREQKSMKNISSDKLDRSWITKTLREKGYM